MLRSKLLHQPLILCLEVIPESVSAINVDEVPSRCQSTKAPRVKDQGIPEERSIPNNSRTDGREEHTPAFAKTPDSKLNYICISCYQPNGIFIERSIFVKNALLWNFSQSLN